MITAEQLRNSAKFGTPLRKETLEELASVLDRQPVAWKFEFNNRTTCTVYDAKEAADIRKCLASNEHETVLVEQVRND